MEEDLQLRQKTVKDILTRHGGSSENIETNEFLLEEFQLLLHGHVLPLYGEEVLTSIVFLENLVDLTREATLEETREAMEGHDWCSYLRAGEEVESQGQTVLHRMSSPSFLRLA